MKELQFPLCIQIKYAKWTAQVASFFYPTVSHAQLHAYYCFIRLGMDLSFISFLLLLLICTKAQVKKKKMYIEKV